MIRPLFANCKREIANDDKRFISALSVLDNVIHGQPLNILKNDEISLIKNIEIIDDLINHYHKLKNNTFPPYINDNIFNSFCKQQKQISINLNYFDIDYPLLSDHFISNKREPNVILISQIVKLFTECTEINILNKTFISSLYLTHLMYENTFVWDNNTVLKKITFSNIKLDNNCNDVILDHHKSVFREYQYELIYDNNDLILKMMDNTMEKSIEYKEIYQFVEEKLSKLLIMDPTQNTNDTQKEYKTASDLLTECTNCTATDIYNECEPMKRIIIILTAYQKLMNHDKLWQKVSILPILTYQNIYTLTQINNDFIHIRDHIDDRSKGNELRTKLKEQFNCGDLSKCHGYRRWRHRLQYSYSKTLNDEDIVFQQECDKIHSYLIHSAEDTAKHSNPTPPPKIKKQISRKMGVYVGKREDEKWWNYTIKDSEDTDDECIYHQLIENMGIFRWQSAHGFTSKQHRGLMHLKPKYNNVKEEVLYNPYYHLSTDEWNQTLRKSKVFYQSWARQRIKTWYDGEFDDQITQQTNKWKKGEDITLQETMILKLYTDFDKLQYELKKCFRFDTISDIFTLKDYNPNISNKYNKYKFEEKIRYKLEERLRAFFSWRVELLTVLNKFAKKLDTEKILYHGVNGKMIINRGPISKYYYGPLSTSSSYHVAKTFATAQGMILQISSEYPRLGGCRAFEASLISDYPEEQEWIIGSIYLRIQEVTTKALSRNWERFQDIDNNDINDVPLASITRSIFFAVHLFRHQIFSMSYHLEYWLTAFLYLQCKYQEEHENNDNGRIKKTKFMETLKKRNYNNLNDDVDDIRHWRILNILWTKFDNFRKYPNQKQVVKIDVISDNLKPYFMDYIGEDIRKKDKYIISFTKIIKIFENVQEIHFINNYVFDNIALNKFIEYVDKNPNHKLKKIKFLYYDYGVIQQQNNNNNDKTRYYPTDSKIFFDPEQLDKDLLNTLKEKKWELKHKNMGKTGYQIQIFSIDTDISKPNHLLFSKPMNIKSISTKKAKTKKFEREEYKQQYSEYKISEEVINTITNRIKEEITNLYHYMIKSIALHKNNVFNTKYDNKQKIKIFNYGFHDEITDKILYCIVTPTNESRFKWKMVHKLFTAYNIEQQFGISNDKLPKALYLQFKSQLDHKKDVENVIESKQDFEEVINNTKWGKIRIYNKNRNIIRKTLSMVNKEFIKQFKHSIYNNDIIDVIPIVMPNKNGKGHHVEFVHHIKHFVEYEFDIGIAYKYEEATKTIKPRGIHLDKELIQSQHELIDPNHKCVCLRNFKSNNIDHLFIGNPDYFENNMNKSKFREQKLSELFKNSQKYFIKMMSNDANMTADNIQIWIDKISNGLKNNKADCSLDLLFNGNDEKEEDDNKEEEEEEEEKRDKIDKNSGLNPNAIEFIFKHGVKHKLCVIHEKKILQTDESGKGGKNRDPPK